MRHLSLALAVAVIGMACVTGTASADPLKSTKAATFDVNCTGLGNVTIVNTDPAHTEALQVVGTNTVVLIPLNGAPGITAQGKAAGTTCTFLNNSGPPGFPATMPAVIIHG